MGRYMPGSQNRSLMAEKEQIARRLIRQGLTTSQIAGQLKCSPFFVRRVRTKLETERGAA